MCCCSSVAHNSWLRYYSVSFAETTYIPSDQTSFFFLLSYTTGLQPRHQIQQVQEPQSLQYTYTALSKHHQRTQSPSQYLHCTSFVQGSTACLYLLTPLFQSCFKVGQNLSALNMARLFEDIQWGAWKEASNLNMLKRFGGKFKQEFSREKQVCIYSKLFYLPLERKISDDRLSSYLCRMGILLLQYKDLKTLNRRPSNLRRLCRQHLQSKRNPRILNCQHQHPWRGSTQVGLLHTAT